MASKRRYKAGLHLAYDKKFNALRVQSEIMNSSYEKPTSHTKLWDKRTIAFEIEKYKGTDDGYLIMNDVWKPSYLKMEELELKQVADDYQKFIQNKINNGYHKPTMMPEELYQRQCIAEAKFDVLTEELEYLQQQYEIILKRKEVVDSSMVLRYGLQQSGRLRNGILAEIDGQNVCLNEDGVLIINDNRSIYSGMSIPDYRDLANLWQADRLEAAEIKYKALRLHAKENGLPQPHFQGVGGTCSKDKLPGWPDGVVNYLKKEIVEK